MAADTTLPEPTPASTTDGTGTVAQSADSKNVSAARSATPAGPAGFAIHGELGRGGMGVVYRATDTALGRPVALKMILSGRYASPLDQARFLVEAEVIAQLQHPNVVQVFGFGRHEDQPYFALEYVDGGTLARRMAAERKFSPAAAARMVLKLAAAMAFAHTKGIIHRDLKPANILLAADGEPKITDFGLARVGAAQETVSGDVLGTPAYMSPEQALGHARDVGTAADVYSLGVILYELLTGCPPFHGETPMHTMQLVVTEDPWPPRATDRDIPRDLETICLKCLNKNPAKRYPTAAGLADDLQAFLDRRPISARRVRVTERLWLRVLRHPALSVALFFLALVLVNLPAVMWFYQGRLDALDKAHASEQDLRNQEAKYRADAQAHARTQEHLAKFHDAQRLIARGDAGWTWAAREQLLAALQFSSPAKDYVGLRSAWLTCETDGDLRPAGTLCELPDTGANLAVSLDGRWVAVGNRAREGANWLQCRVRVYGVESRACTHDWAFPCGLVSGPNHLRFVPDGVRVIAFSPDSRWLFAGARSGRVHRWDLRNPSLPPTTWTHSPAEATALAFSPDARSVYVLYQTGLLVRTATDGDGSPAATFQAPAAAGRAAGLAYADARERRWAAPRRKPAATPPVLVVGSAYRLTVVDPTDLTERPTPFEPPPDTGGVPHALAVVHDPATGAVYLRRPRGVVGLDPVSWREAAQFPAPRGEGTTGPLALSPDGELLAGLTDRGAVVVWSAVDGSQTARVPVGAAFDVAFAASGRALFVATDQGVQAYEVGRSGLRRPAGLAGRTVLDFADLGPGAGLVTLTALAAANDLTDPELSGDPRRALPVVLDHASDDGWRYRVAAAGDRMLCCLPEGDGYRVYSVDGATLAHREIGEPLQRFSDFALVPGGDRFWSAEGASVRLRSTDTGKSERQWLNAADAVSGRGGVTAVCLGQAGLLAGCRDGRVVLLGEKADDPLRSWATTRDEITAVAFAADGSAVLVGTAKGDVFELPLASDRPPTGRNCHRDAVAGIAPSPSDGGFVTASRTGEVTHWLRTGDGFSPQFVVRQPPGSFPIRVGFSIDGGRLSVLYHGGRGVTTWDVRRFREHLRDAGLVW